MKKLMFILATLALAFSVQGAAISWKTGIAIKAPNLDGTISSSNAGSGTLSMYVWLVDEALYSAATANSIIADYSERLGSANGSVTGKSGAAGVTVKTDGLDFTVNQDTTYYGLILTEYKSGDVTQYVANKATAIINGSGDNATITNLSKYWGGGANGTAVTWTAVPSPGDGPEPTTGLLLIVGGAMLALRRKQK